MKCLDKLYNKSFSSANHELNFAFDVNFIEGVELRIWHFVEYMVMNSQKRTGSFIFMLSS